MDMARRKVGDHGRAAGETPDPSGSTRRCGIHVPDVTFLDGIMPYTGISELTERPATRPFNGRLALVTGREPSTMRTAPHFAEPQSGATVANRIE